MHTRVSPSFTIIMKVGCKGVSKGLQGLVSVMHSV